MFVSNILINDIDRNKYDTEIHETKTKKETKNTVNLIFKHFSRVRPKNKSPVNKVSQEESREYYTRECNTQRNGVQDIEHWKVKQR